MFWNKEITDINWNHLNQLDQLISIKEESKDRPVLIYKHSTRCSISSMALDRLERSWNKELEPIKAYYLDLIRFRDISNAVAESFKINHESPQVILIKNGEVVYYASHMSISAVELEKYFL